jgi:drug/metabolite transporter (DMT)-like permease
MLKESLNPEDKDESKPTLISSLSNELYKKNSEEEKNNKKDQIISIEDKISEANWSIKSFSKRERMGFLYCLIAQFIWTTNSVYVKFITQYFRSRFKNKTFLFPRGLAIILISYLLGRNYDGKIYSLSEFPSKIQICLLTRANVSFFGMCFWLVAVYNLRITTCQIISTLNPIVLVYFGVIFLKEKYYSRYAVGILLGIIGSSIIVLNENKINEKEQESNTNYSNVFIGLISMAANVLLSGVIGVVNKIMADKKISLYTQLFYFGIFHSLYSFLWMLFTNDFDYTILYFFLCATHACLFFLGNYFNYIGLKLIDLSKTSLLQYTKIIFVFLLGSLLLGEKVFFSDIVGSVIIISYMIYHVINPIK